MTATAVGGSANAITLTLPITPAGLTDGLTLRFTAAASNTGATTLNCGVGGAATVRWPDATTLAANDILSGAVVEVTYSTTGTTGWNLMSVTSPVVKGLLTTRGDLFMHDGATIARYAAGANGTIPISTPSPTVGRTQVAALTSMVWGLSYQNNAGDATNDLDIAAGFCMDATGAWPIVVSALTKRSDANWSVGTNQGMLDTGAVGNSDYYLWAISRSDTSVSDILCSLSSTAPTMPANYDYKRLIGWFKRTGGTIVAFKTYEITGGGLQFLWSSPTLDVNLLNTLTTSRRTDAVKVPLNIATRALLNVTVADSSAAFDVYIYCPDLTDLAPGDNTTAPLATFRMVVAANVTEAGQVEIRTSATGTIAARASIATVDQYSVATLGFTMDRRI